MGGIKNYLIDNGWSHRAGYDASPRSSRVYKAPANARDSVLDSYQ
jgi:hypothetical protein